MLSNPELTGAAKAVMGIHKSGHQPRKRFGQNFLQDDAVIQGIARAINPTAEDHLVEIGPGQGALTQALVTSGCQFDAIELDRDLTTTLLAAFSIHKRFTLHSADALNVDYGSFVQNGETLRIVGNLPYNISTPLIFKLLDQADIVTDMHFMLQKEVVERLAASPGTKDWGRLGIMAQLRCEVTHLFDVPPEAFYPPPKVQSAIVRLIPYPVSPYPKHDVKTVSAVVQLAFSQRRKTLRNNFKGVFDDDQLRALGIDPGDRAELLEIEQFIALAELQAGQQTGYA